MNLDSPAADRGAAFDVVTEKGREKLREERIQIL